MRYWMFLLGLLWIDTASALDCEKVPDCTSLGYSQEEDTDCEKDGFMYCPFDKSYKKCVQYNCEALGFTESDKTSWCADLVECKGNSKMTLCQKPCFATDYNSLKDLAGSGHCKVVTMRDDITLPQNQGITLAADTIIDGGNHTLNSSGNKGFNVYTLNNNSGFKNIFIEHNQTQSQADLYVFKSINGSKVTLHDTKVLVQSNDAQNHATQVFRDGTYEISGKFTTNIEATWHYILSKAILMFKDADINVTTTGTSGDGFYGNANFINSRGTITTSAMSMMFDSTLTFENSQIHLNAPLKAIFYTEVNKGKYGPILLKDNAELRLTFSNLTGGAISDADNLAHIKFESSASAPATLIIEGTGKLDSGDVTANNTANTVVLNGVTCHPKKATTTVLSEIPKSDDWTCTQN